MSDENSNNSNASNARAPLPLTAKQREAKQAKFLKAYGEVGIVKYACKVAGINRSTFYYWRDHDQAFAEQLPDVVEDAHDTLEYAAYAQAVLGVEEYAINNMGVVFLNGKPVINRKYAPSVLITLLKANMPEKYKERVANEHTGKDGGPMEFITEWGGGALEEDEESEG